MEGHMAKSATFGVIHLGIAFAVSYLLTGSVAISGAITLVEPVVNTVAHYGFDRLWDHPRWVSRRTRLAVVLRRRVPRSALDET
jgi:uncharacterized membrane protein